MYSSGKAFDIVRPLFVMAPIISVAVVLVALGMPSGTAYGASVEENKKRLLETRECPGCDLNGANLTDTNLSGAELSGANLHGANLMGANLKGANLKGANLHGANLMDSNLEGANLVGAYLVSANLARTNLKDAKVKGAMFTVTRGLTLEQRKYLMKNGVRFH